MGRAALAAQRPIALVQRSLPEDLEERDRPVEQAAVAALLDQMAMVLAALVEVALQAAMATLVLAELERVPVALPAVLVLSGLPRPAEPLEAAAEVLKQEETGVLMALEEAEMDLGLAAAEVTACLFLSTPRENPPSCSRL